MKMSDDLQHLGPGQRKGEKDRVARRNVGDRDPVRHLVRRPPFGNVDVGGQRRSAERVQPDPGDHVPLHADARGDARRRLQLDLVPLPVVERERVACVPVAPRQRQAGGRIEASAQSRQTAFLGGEMNTTVNPIVRYVS